MNQVTRAAVQKSVTSPPLSPAEVDSGRPCLAATWCTVDVDAMRSSDHGFGSAGSLK